MSVVFVRWCSTYL